MRPDKGFCKKDIEANAPATPLTEVTHNAMLPWILEKTSSIVDSRPKVLISSFLHLGHWSQWMGWAYFFNSCPPKVSKWTDNLIKRKISKILNQIYRFNNEISCLKTRISYERDLLDMIFWGRGFFLFIIWGKVIYPKYIDLILWHTQLIVYAVKC